MFFQHEIKYNARVIEIKTSENVNPNFRMSRQRWAQDYSAVGSNERYHIIFRNIDDTLTEVSVSPQKAGKFQVGMVGTLVHRSNILISFKINTET